MPCDTPRTSPAAAYAPAVVRVRLDRGSGAHVSGATACSAPSLEGLHGRSTARPVTHSGFPVGTEEPSESEGGAFAPSLDRLPSDRPPGPPTSALPSSSAVHAPRPGLSLPGTTSPSRRRLRRGHHPPLVVCLGLSARHTAASGVAAAQPFFLPALVGAPRRRRAVPLWELPSPASIFSPVSSNQGRSRKPAAPSAPTAMGATDDDVSGAPRSSVVSRTGVGVAPVWSSIRDRTRSSIAGAEARGLIVSPWVFPARENFPSRGPRLIRRMVTAASGKGGYAVIIPRQTATSAAVAGAASGVVARTELKADGRNVERVLGRAEQSSKASLASVPSSSAPWWSTSLEAPAQYPGAVAGRPKRDGEEHKQPPGSTIGPRRLLPPDLDETIRSTEASDGGLFDQDRSTLELDLDSLDSSVSSASANDDMTSLSLPPPTSPPHSSTRMAVPAALLHRRDDSMATISWRDGCGAVIVSLDTDDESGSLALDPAPKLPISQKKWLAADSWLSLGRSETTPWSQSAPRSNASGSADDAAAIAPPESPLPLAASSSPKPRVSPPFQRLPPVSPPSSSSFDREHALPSSRRPPLPPKSRSRRSPRSASGQRPPLPVPEGPVVSPPGPAQAPPPVSTTKPRRHIFWGGVNSTASTVQTWSSSMSSASTLSVSSSSTEEDSGSDDPGSSRRGWFIRTAGGGTTRSGLQSKRPPSLSPLW